MVVEGSGAGQRLGESQGGVPLPSLGPWAEFGNACAWAQLE